MFQVRSLIYSYNLTQTIDTPTQITPTSQTCLDQIIIDCDYFSYAVENIKIKVSDHNSTFLRLQLLEKELKNDKTFSYKRLFTEENIEYFKYMLCKEKSTQKF